MKSALWISSCLLLLTMAGCVDDEPLLTDDDCRVDGLILDPAVEQVDEETGETFVGPACVEDIPSVTASLGALPATSNAYTPIDVTWILHTTLDEDHSHNNGIRISTESNPSYLGKVDGYGYGLLGGKEEHRNFVEGDSSTVTWTPEDAGTYYVRVYAVSAWGNYWGPEQTVEVAEVAPTGVQETVTIAGGGLPQITSLDPDTLDIALGDAIEWTSSDPGITWTVYFVSTPDSLDEFASYVVGDDPRVFRAPGEYRYRAISTDPNGEKVGEIDGTVNVAFPQ